MQNIFITGGAGYVGSLLTPFLIEQGHNVTVLDLFIYGEDVFQGSFDRTKLNCIKGDIRDRALLEKSIPGHDVVIHLACISNDPSFDLNPDLGKSINLDSFRPLVETSKNNGVKRFIYASSSSVYGVKSEDLVHEELSLEPLTDYSRFKAECETVLNTYADDGFTVVSVRPATVCGYSPRQRLDVIVNILANHAFFNRKILVFGGEQKRPNIHIKDMIRVYLQLIQADSQLIQKKIYNAGIGNYSVKKLAEIVKEVVGGDVTLEYRPTDDPRSYKISSEKIQNELNFQFNHTIDEAVSDLMLAFKDSRLQNTFNDKRFYNIKTMLECNLQ